MKLTEAQRDRLIEMAQRAVRRGPVGTSITISPSSGKILRDKGLALVEIRQWGSRGKRERVAICEISSKGMEVAIQLILGGPILSL